MSDYLPNEIDIYKKKIKRFSGLSRKQLGLFLVSAFSFVVSFSWNAFAQNVFQTLVPSNVKNYSSILLVLQLLYALLVTFLGAVIIAYVNSRPNRVKDFNKELVEIRDDVKKLVAASQRK